MDAGRPDRDPQTTEDDPQAAGGGPSGVGYPTYAERASELLDLGYEPLPIRPGQKRPAPAQWSSVPIDEGRVQAWSDSFPDHGIGLRTGRLVGIDNRRALDADLAHRLQHLAMARLGPAPMRVGLWPEAAAALPHRGGRSPS